MGLSRGGQGRWEESTRDLERAIELDPRNLLRCSDRPSYRMLRRYAKAKISVVPSSSYRA